MQLVCVSYFEMSFWNFRWMFCGLDNQFSKSEVKPKLYACSATKSPADSAGGLDVSSGWFRPSPAQKALIRTKLAGEPAPRLLFAYRGNSSLIWICACLWAPCQPLVLNAPVLLSPGVRSISGHCRSSCCSPALTRFPWAGDKDSSSSVLSIFLLASFLHLWKLRTYGGFCPHTLPTDFIPTYPPSSWSCYYVSEG